MDALNPVHQQRGPKMEHGFYDICDSHGMKEASDAIKHFSHFKGPEKENAIE